MAAYLEGMATFLSQYPPFNYFSPKPPPPEEWVLVDFDPQTKIEAAKHLVASLQNESKAIEAVARKTFDNSDKDEECIRCEGVRNSAHIIQLKLDEAEKELEKLLE